MERRYGTNPTNLDTDGDCIPDGMEDANHNGIYDIGETNAVNPDTDGDGLSDGNIAGVGEDLNCNGIADVSADDNKLETDPRLADTDGDGQNDFVEMTCGDVFDLANIEKATDPEISCGM